MLPGTSCVVTSSDMLLGIRDLGFEEANVAEQLEGETRADLTSAMEQSFAKEGALKGRALCTEPAQLSGFRLCGREPGLLGATSTSSRLCGEDRRIHMPVGDRDPAIFLLNVNQVSINLANIFDREYCKIKQSQPKMYSCLSSISHVLSNLVAPNNTTLVKLHLW